MKKDIEMTESAASDEVSVSPQPLTFEDAGQAISQGKRHLLVRDYGLAAATLAEGVGMLAHQHGEIADELAEPYLLYGKALLYLAREEAGVLGSGVPGAEEEGEEEDEAEEEPEEKDKEDGKEDAKEATTEEAKPETDDKEKENPAEDKEKAAVEEKKPEEPAAEGSGSSSAGPSGSSTSKMNGGASTSGLQQNGDAHNTDDDGEDVDEEDDDANNSLKIAWEVLELAKIILTKRGPPGWKLLADTHRLLGEVSMEGGNQPSALIDLNACLDLLQKIEPVDPRSMAEVHYQLGLTHSLGNEFEASIEQFLKATSLLEARIKDLELSKEETAEEEIKELKELLPEIQDKISDMRDFKSQAAKLVIEKIKSMSGGSCSNGSGSSGEGASSLSIAKTATSPKEVKPASDISHLVRKKRKNEDGEEEEAAGSPCKKPLSEKSA